MTEVEVETILIVIGFAFSAVVATLIAIVFHARQDHHSVAEERDAVELEAIKGHLEDEQKVVSIR